MLPQLCGPGISMCCGCGHWGEKKRLYMFLSRNNSAYNCYFTQTLWRDQFVCKERKEKMSHFWSPKLEKLKLCVNLPPLYLQPIIKSWYSLLWNVSPVFFPLCSWTPPTTTIVIQTFVPHHFESGLLQQGWCLCLCFPLSLLPMLIPGLPLPVVSHSERTLEVQAFVPDP